MKAFKTNGLCFALPAQHSLTNHTKGTITSNPTLTILACNPRTNALLACFHLVYIRGMGALLVGVGGRYNKASHKWRTAGIDIIINRALSRGIID